MSELGIKKLTPENWLQPCIIASMIHDTTTDQPITQDQWLDRILTEVSLDPAVPDDVQTIFEVARAAMAYAYFYYPFLALGEAHLYQAAEAAVTLKCLSMDGPKPKKSLEEKLNWLRARGVLSDDGRKGWDALRTLRNESSHPKFQAIQPPSIALFMLRDIAIEINALFTRSESMEKLQKLVLEKWRKDIEEIYKDVVFFHFRRQIFHSLREVMQNNPNLQKPNAFIRWMIQNYTIAQAVGVRRHVDLDSRSASLSRLLQELIDNPNVLTRQEFIELYEGSSIDPNIADGEFDEYANGNGNNLDIALLKRDQAILRKLCDPIRHYVNKSIAHLELDKIIPIPTYGDLDAAIDGIANLVKKYMHLLKAVSAEINPTIPPWEHILNIPWIVGSNDA